MSDYQSFIDSSLKDLKYTQERQRASKTYQCKEGDNTGRGGMSQALGRQQVMEAARGTLVMTVLQAGMSVLSARHPEGRSPDEVEGSRAGDCGWS